MASTQKPLPEQKEKNLIDDESKYEDALLDDAIINALKGEHKAFCLKMEKYLTEFMKSNESSRVIENLDKYQRKIVHKLCDIFEITRDYVDVKDELGDITIVKSEKSKIPAQSVEEKYALMTKKNKTAKASVNPLANKKLIMKPKEKPQQKSESDSSDSQDNEQSMKDDTTEKKQQEYEKARERIMKEGASEPKHEENDRPKNIIQKPKKKGQKFSETMLNYDDYDRSRDVPLQSANLINSAPFYPQQYGGFYGYGNGYQNTFPNQFPPGLGYGQGYQGAYQNNRNVPENGGGYNGDFPSLENSMNASKKK